MSVANIKSMQLYSHVDRIYNDLASVGIKDQDPLNVDLLIPFDQLHYFGTDAVDDAIEHCRVDHASRVLDVGAGLGGPARYLADRTGAKVTAVELQEDMNEIANSLTTRCGLADTVNHVCADILSASLDQKSFDAIVSWLALYHIPDHRSLYQRLQGALKPGGMLYVEDLFAEGEFNEQESDELARLFYGENMQSREDYISDLEKAGFIDIEFEDVTDAWRPFVANRLEKYRADRDEKVRVHGVDVVDALDGFYDVAVRFFESGKVRGVRLTARAG